MNLAPCFLCEITNTTNLSSMEQLVTRVNFQLAKLVPL